MSETSPSLSEFRHFRAKMNEAILAADNLVIKRFFALDTQTYKAGTLDGKTKELLGRKAPRMTSCSRRSRWRWSWAGPS